MRIPDPIANTTTEAYLAYKAGVLAEGDLKPKLYDPYIHLDAWLAYWAGLTNTYPVKNVGKNLFDIAKVNHLALSGTIVESDAYRGYTLKVFPGETYTISRASTSAPGRFRYCFTKVVPAAGGAYYGLQQIDSQTKDTFTVPDEMNYLLVYLSNSNETITESMGIQLERGSEATAYEPYTGEPEMLTDEEALIAYLSGVTDTYPEEFRDPADVRVAAYLKYLVSARWGRPEYPVTNEELYLSMMDAPYIPAGEPSSDIEIDDTAEAPFKDVKMYGDTSQTTYTGKNLFNLVTPDTNNGVTVTANADGSFTINGTTTGVAVFNFILPELKPAGTYTISCTSKNQVMDSGFFIRARNQNMSMLVPGGADGPSQIMGTGANYAEKTFVSTDPMYCLALNFTTTGVTYNNMIIYPQVEVGGTVTDWERYVGNQASPNPDYPQAVNTVTGRQVVKISDGQGNEQSYEINLGKNLFDKDAGNILNAYIDLGTNKIVANDYNRIVYIPCSPNTTYAISVMGSKWGSEYGWTKDTPAISVDVYDRGTLGSNQTNTTITTGSDARYIVFRLWQRYNSGESLDEALGALQIEVGSAPTSYAPYFTPIELCKIGDYQDYIYENDGKWYVRKEIGKGIYDGSEDENWTSSATYRADIAIPDAVLGSSTNNPVLCNRYKAVWATANGNIFLSGLWHGAGMVDTTNMTSISAWRTYLASNNVEIYYALATETDTEITNTALIDQLNALKNGGSYTGTTYIRVSATDPNLPGLLEVEAYKYD